MRRNGRSSPQRRRLTIVALALVALALIIAAILGKGGSARVQPPAGVGHTPQRHGHPAPARSPRSPAAEAAQESASSPELQRLIALGKPIYCAGNRGDEVALTFDDGPGQYTRLALAKLKKHGIKATFFIVGRNVPLMPDAIRSERELGAVGDHTFTHPLLTSLSGAAAEAEIARTKTAVERASGGPVYLFRPPYGGRNANIDAIVRAHGLLEILWTVDSADSLGASYAQIERNVINGLKPGAIILMHENHGQTIRAMLSIFAALQRKHLHPVSVLRLLRDDPPSEAVVRAGGSGCGVGAIHGG